MKNSLWYFARSSLQIRVTLYLHYLKCVTQALDVFVYCLFSGSLEFLQVTSLCLKNVKLINLQHAKNGTVFVEC